MMVQPRLRAPADIQCRMHVLFGIVHDIDQFVPVVHGLEWQLLHGRAGDDHAVEGMIPDLRKRLVKPLQMLRCGVFGLMALGPQQRDVDLQRRIAEQPQQLGFRGDLGRHQIDDGDFQRPDVLTVGAAFRHDENVFALQYRARGQIFGNLDRHGTTPSLR